MDGQSLSPRAGELHDTLRQILERAGHVALDLFRSSHRELKADRSFVTDADRASEEVLVESLRRAFPGVGIRGEEGAREEGDGTWYVDPIDGTHGYVEGLAHWGPTVVLVREGRLELGAFYLPRLDEFWFAGAGMGAWRDGTRLQAPDVDAVGHNSTLYVPSRFHLVGRVPWPGKLRVLGSTAAHLAIVAAGGGTAALAMGDLWDIGCGILLVTESGRAICGLDGGSWSVAENPGLPFLAGAPTALEYLTREAGVAAILLRARQRSRQEA